MTDYAIVYHAATKMPSSPEEGAANRAQWETWLKDLGDAVVNPGTPFGKSHIVSSDGSVSEAAGTGLTGFSVVKADNEAAAIEIAKQCPYLMMGNVEVAEIKSM